jgi:VWFA-related protein
MRSHRARKVLPVCLVVTAAVLAGRPEAAAPTPQEHVVRTAYVTVLDASDAPITDLKPEEVLVLEDGNARAVTEIKPAPEPLTVALLVDTAKPVQGQQAPTRDLRVGLATFLKIVQGANPASKIAVMDTAGAAVMVQNFTDSTADLTRAANRLIPSARTSAVVLEALVDIGKVMAKQPGTRRAVVSVDFDSQDTSGVQGKDIAQAIQTAGASVWAISIHGASGGSGQREAGLDAITEISGGLRLTGVGFATLESKLQIVAKALTSQYLVSYLRPANTASVTQVRAAATRGAKFLATRIITK